MTISDFQELFAYDEWANSRICDAAATLTLEEFARPLTSCFASVRDTLAHIAAAEWIRWSARKSTTRTISLADGGSQL
jgi:uncharacterized damage-inducible protein DinB